MSTKFIILSVQLFPIILSTITLSAALTLMSSSLHQGNMACPGQQVMFTCLAPDREGALVMTWSSEEYIGEGGVQLMITHDKGEGYETSSSSHPTTMATLVKLRGKHILESILSIVVSSQYAAATITCGIVGQNDSSISFQLLAIPNALQNITVLKTALQTKCIMTLHWASPSNETIIGHYIINYSYGNFKTSGGGSRNNASLFLEDCKADNFMIYAVDVCDREGASLGRDDAVKLDVKVLNTAADTMNTSVVTCAVPSVYTDKVHMQSANNSERLELDKSCLYLCLLFYSLILKTFTSSLFRFVCSTYP